MWDSATDLNRPKLLLCNCLAASKRLRPAREKFKHVLGEALVQKALGGMLILNAHVVCLVSDV